MDQHFSKFISDLAIGVPGLLIAIVFHEVAHGYMALKFNDPTAKDAGRLSLNPLAHLDPLGSFLIPVFGAFFGGILFGWAKPVPINPRNFNIKDYRKAIFWVSFAGPLMNFALILICGILRAIIITQVPRSFFLAKPFYMILTQSIYINTILGVFNLIPLPPLDGSKMVSAFLSYPAQRKFEEFGRFSFIILLILIFTGATQFIFEKPLTWALEFCNGLVSLFWP